MQETKVSLYPNFDKIEIDFRPELHNLFQQLSAGISEFTFANLFLFRETHHYRISKLEENSYLIIGKDGKANFFMLPFEIPDKSLLDEFFSNYGFMKAASEMQTDLLKAFGYQVFEDRDNFDYLYLRSDLARLAGRKFHKKKNLVNAFINNYSYQGKPLTEEYYPDAIEIIEKWSQGRPDVGDAKAARNAIENAELLQLCGCIYFVDGTPAAFTMGEELANGESFVVHFEKALNQYKGIYQFINQCLALALPKKYKFINREQDLGNPGLRQAKMSYRPMGFVKKYKVMP